MLLGVIQLEIQVRNRRKPQATRLLKKTQAFNKSWLYFFLLVLMLLSRYPDNTNPPINNRNL